MYKRQVGNYLNETGLAAINVAYPITAFILATGTALGMGGSIFISISRGKGAVSYTHLDVYKRQDQSGVRGWQIHTGAAFCQAAKGEAAGTLQIGRAHV